MKRWYRSVVFLMLAVMLALSGCGSGATKGTDGAADSSAQKPADGKSALDSIPADPVTLTFYVYAVKLTDSEFQKFFVEPLKKKHPNITLEQVTASNPEDLVAGGTVPDIILADTDWFMPLNKLNLPMDLSDLIKKANIDMGQFVSQSVQGVKGLTDGKTMSGLPFSINAGALFYNKNLFDKFGVAYPTDGMTWDQVVSLSRKLTREEDGTQYIGWDPGFPDAIESPYSNPFVDPKTNKALIDIPVYHTIFNMLKDVYDQPGYIGKGNKFAYGPDSFIKDQNLAMISEWMIKMLYPLIDASDQGTFKDWDLVDIPNFAENAGKGRHALTSILMISNTSPHKEQAMQVLQMVASPEGQMLQSRNARITVLNDKKIEKQFGADVPALQGKNVASVFKLPPSAVPKPNINDKDVQPFIRQVRNALIVDKKDVNTALRDAQAAADKKLAELQAQ